MILIRLTMSLVVRLIGVWRWTGSMSLNIFVWFDLLGLDT